MNSATFKRSAGLFLVAILVCLVFQFNGNVVVSRSGPDLGANFRSSYLNSSSIAFSEPSLQEKNIFILVNVERRKEKLRNLKWDHDLWRMAEYYSRKMADENFFDHLDPDGRSVVDRAKQFKIKNWTKIGENLFFADGYISPTGEAVTGWMNSEGHRENILDKDWTHSAIGVYEARGRKTYVTQLFLRR